MKEIWTVVFGLILTCLIIYMAYRFSRMLAQRTAGRFKNRYLKEIDRMVMGQEEYISLVRIGSEVHLIGVTKQNINYMSKIDDEILIELEKEEKQVESHSPDFPTYGEFFGRLKDKMSVGKKQNFENSDKDKMLHDYKEQAATDRQKDLEND